MDLSEEFAPGRELIIVEMAAQRFAIDVMRVREIRGWTASTRLPQSPEHVLGMINLRGSVLPVVDLSARLGLGGCEPNAASVVVVTEIRGQLVGLLVDAVCDILTLAEGMAQPPPAVGASETATFVKGVITSGEEIITLLALDSVVTDQDLDIAA
jgi:purine-binding chemotaxis protein CheW